MRPILFDNSSSGKESKGKSPMTGKDHDHEHGSELSETQLRVRALETILTEKGYVDPAALDAIVETYETKVGPRNGSLVVAKAWTDPAFRQELLKETEIRVWDSTAETRFIVLPMRPAGTEGWSEERLADLVTRDSMIGTGLAKQPAEVAR